MIEIGPARERHLRWLIEKTGTTLTSAAKGIVAERDGKTIGVVGYDLWTVNSVHAHMAVEEPIAWRRLLPYVFVYPFETRGILLGVIRSDNARSLRMSKHLGFRETHRIRDGVEIGCDLVFIEMRREECRFLGVNHG